MIIPIEIEMESGKFRHLYSKIKSYGIVPLLKIDDTNKAVQVAEALASGGLNIAGIIAENASELKHAFEAAKKISAAFPDMLLAVRGNISAEEEIKQAADSGVKFIIAHEPDEKITAPCEKNNIAVISDDFILISEDINADNIADYLSRDFIIACGVSFMAEEKYIIESDFENIKNLTSRSIKKMLGFDLSHVVVNCESDEQAEQYSSKIESIFGFEKNDVSSAFSNADILYFTKSKSYGRNGQIAISTNFLERAVFYLKETKKEFIDDSARFDANGKLISIYLDNIIGGFAIKLVRSNIAGESLF